MKKKTEHLQILFIIELEYTYLERYTFFLALNSIRNPPYTLCSIFTSFLRHFMRINKSILIAFPH